MDLLTDVHNTWYSFLTDPKPEAELLGQMAVQDLAHALDESAVGFLDSDIVLRALLTAFLDKVPPEEIEPEILTRAGGFGVAFSERVLMHPRIRLSPILASELAPIVDKAEELIARDIAAYSVSYASLEARRLVPFLREYRASLDAFSTGLRQVGEAQLFPHYRQLYASILKLVESSDAYHSATEDQLPDHNLIAAVIYELLVRAAEGIDPSFQILLLSSDPMIRERLYTCVRLLTDAGFAGGQHRLMPLFAPPRHNGSATHGGRITVISYDETTRRFGPAYHSTDASKESLDQLKQRVFGDPDREALALQALNEIIAEHEKAFDASIITLASALIEVPTGLQAETPPFQEESKPTMDTTQPDGTMPAPSTSVPDDLPDHKSEPDEPTLSNLSPSDNLMMQTLRKLHQRCYVELSQISGDVEKLGTKLLTDEGTRRIAERCDDNAFAQALAQEVARTRQVIEGKLAILQTQKSELLQKKSALNAEIEALRASPVMTTNSVEREMDLLRRDAEVGRNLGDVLNKLRAYSPLADSLNRIGSGAGMMAVASAEGTYRLSQLVEELGEEPHNVSALIKQLREKGILPPKHSRGVYTAQERQLIIDLYHSKSVSELSRELGNAVTTLKQAIMERLTEGRDYYNLGKGSQRDSFRVTPIGLAKLKGALSFTRARH